MAIKRFKTTLKSITKITPTVKKFTITTPTDFSFKAGQFITLILPITKEKKIRRSYSIASPPNQKNTIDLVIKIVPDGQGTHYLDSINKEAELEALGPMGNFIIEENTNNNTELVFICTGTGITPFLSMIPNILSTNPNKNITLLCGFRYEEEILEQEWSNELQKEHTNFKRVDIISRPKEDNTKNIGRVQKLIQKYVDNKNNKQQEAKKQQTNFYICGLTDMITEVADLLKEKGIKEDQIHFEKYD